MDKLDFESNMKLVSYVIKTTGYFRSKINAGVIEYDDLFQIGSIALFRCVNNFDPSLGIRFSSYAVTSIKRDIHNYVRRMSFAVTIPKLMEKARIVKINFLAKNPQATESEILAYLKKTDIPKWAAEFALHSDPVSLNTALPESGETFQDFLMDDPEIEANVSNELTIEALLSKVANQKEKAILELARQGYNQVEIAKLIGVSQPTISRTLKKYLDLFKEVLAC